MKLISIYYILIITLLPPLYWLLLKEQNKKYFLAIISILCVTFFFPFSALFMGLVSLLVFFLLKFIRLKKKGIIALLPLAFFLAYKIINKNLPDTGNNLLNLIGISFFSLKIIHFCIDYSNGQIKDLNFFNFMFYLFFFPIFTAGPIIRYEEFTDNLIDNRPEISEIKKGTRRIALGFFKKLILLFPFFIQNEYSLRNGLIQTSPKMGLALLIYSFYIYWDFSSYTDIAIGTSLLFNYKVPENFQTPYFKRNISLFWQNWHITLTRWLQNYIFVPLSKRSIRHIHPKFFIIGNGVSQMITMLLCGFWHGSGLNYILWGGYHGLGLFGHTLYKNSISSERKIKNRTLKSICHLLYTALTFLFVTAGWVFFSAPAQIALRNFTVLLGIK
ncbi:MAG: hypothetical protein PHF84_05070 [bacterium]|nr:hypothetical protein [bacterium]